eukprot:365171-Chlamydomonas_euryale.AAC.11
MLVQRQLSSNWKKCGTEARVKSWDVGLLSNVSIVLCFEDVNQWCDALATRDGSCRRYVKITYRIPYLPYPYAVGNSGRALPRQIKGPEALQARHWGWMPVPTCSADVRAGNAFDACAGVRSLAPHASASRAVGYPRERPSQRRPRSTNQHLWGINTRRIGGGAQRGAATCGAGPRRCRNRKQGHTGTRTYAPTAYRIYRIHRMYGIYGTYGTRHPYL